MYYVYIIKSSKDGMLYTGSTNDLKRRLKEHNSGQVFSTKYRRPFEEVYYEAYKNEKDARDREKKLEIEKKSTRPIKKEDDKKYYIENPRTNVLVRGKGRGSTCPKKVYPVKSSCDY